MSLHYGLLLLLCAVITVHCERLENHSFEPPFDEIEAASGNRVVHKQWKTHGNAVVNSNFVRLTPDRQSKKGALWSKKALGVSEFSAILKFRISGQGKNFFGDGIGLWMVQQGYYTEGPLHGFNEKFYGIGIIFDTFKNTENLAKHRDVTILVNDGEQTYELMTDDVQGCSASLRYHADRADFSVSDTSRVKVKVQGNNLEVYVDAKNEGEWTQCVSLPELPLKHDWANRAYLGLTASTGALADNHDILSLSTYSDHEVMELAEEEKAAKREFPLSLKSSTPDRLIAIENQLDAILKRFNTLDHHLEHELVAVEDHISNLGSKINKREDSSEGRIEMLEETMTRKVDGTIAERLNHIERQLKGTVDRKITNVADNLERKLDVKVSKSAASNAASAANAQIDSSNGDWKIPFLMLFLLFVAGAIGFYRFYEKMKRSHIL